MTSLTCGCLAAAAFFRGASFRLAAGFVFFRRFGFFVICRVRRAFASGRAFRVFENVFQDFFTVTVFHVVAPIFVGCVFVRIKPLCESV